jgi:hypothetical protein
MVLGRRLALSCMLLTALAGCTEGQKPNPLSRAGAPSSSTAATTAPTKSTNGLYQSPLGDTAKSAKETSPER